MVENTEKPLDIPPAAAAEAPKTQPENACEQCEKSWGDRFKKNAFNKGTYVGINYFINAIGSAWLTYFFERKYLKGFTEFSHTRGAQLAAATNTNPEKMERGIFKVIRSLLLTTVGNLLAPVIKLLEDRRHRIEFKIGHQLDKMQNMFGKANSATRRNLAEYNKIQQAVKSGDSSGFSEEDLEKLRIQHRIKEDESGKLAFKEHKLPWAKVLGARFVGWTAAQLTNFAFGRSETNKNEWLNYKGYENKVSPKIDKYVLKKIPGFSRAVQDTRKFSDMLFNDFLLTISSSVTHRAAQGLMHKETEAPPREPEKENKSSSGTSRDKILAAGARDFRAREEARASEPSLVTP